MRFYMLYLAILTLCMIVLPLLPNGLGEEKIVIEEEALVAMVEPLPIEHEKQEEKESEAIPTISTGLDIQDFRIKNASSGKVEQVAIEDFVLGAVCSEMPATFHLEALKAQAVSARTWAAYQQLWQRNHPDEKLDGADFQSDPDNWKGYVTEEQAKKRFGDLFEEYWPILSKAVQETEGQILCVEGEPIAAAYHAISAGQTEAAEYVWGSPLTYLQPVNSRGDELAPGFEETITLTEQELKIIYPSSDFEGDGAAWLEILERSPSGYVTKIRVGDLEQSGLAFRTALGLRSSHFTISHEEKTFRITTQGYGHGAGLSQYGADFMARQGSSYEEILSHYYQGAELQILS